MESGEEWWRPFREEPPPSGFGPVSAIGENPAIGAQSESESESKSKKEEREGWRTSARVVVVETRESQLISIDRDDSPRGPAWRRGAWRHGGHLCGL
ncbi:hypothetical protein K0M31_015885 [Melipona bicolor]|uniref:Uncharacterized protein n=1 Tax=Melipona bicolor TaxID=60889 RepID=A0AA40G605_9HYME|nr:hypothetical protein K0M31_015885 [Melipona bicolor]